MSVRCRTRMVDLRLHNIERATPFWTWFLFAAAPLCWTSEAIGTRDLPRAFRTADLWLIHAADCCSRYSSWTCCGVRY